MRGLHALLVVSILPSCWCAGTKTNLQTPHDRDPWRFPIAKLSDTLLMLRLFRCRLDLSLYAAVDESRDCDVFVCQVAVRLGLANATLGKIVKIIFWLIHLFSSDLRIFYVKFSFFVGAVPTVNSPATRGSVKAVRRGCRCNCVGCHLDDSNFKLNF